MDLTGYIRQGNAFAFEQAFLQWRTKVYAYFLLKTRDVSTAVELTQIAFIKLWNSRATLSDDYSLETQIFRIARTSLIDYLRASARKRKFEQGLQEDKTDVFVAPLEPGSHISYALNMLPPVRKKVFVLSRIDGFSNKEIAEELSISGRTVEKHISLAMKQLKKILTVLTCLIAIH
jgi:RNA polymerase sigma factor (sigma-70 family)